MDQDDIDFDQFLLNNFDSIEDFLVNDCGAAKVFLVSKYSSLRLERYERWGDVQDLEEALSKARWALERTSENNENLPIRLEKLSIILVNRFKRLGWSTDLEEAIISARNAIEITPEDYPNPAAGLNNLGNMLEMRYERTGKVMDLEEAINSIQNAIKITPEDHPFLAAWLNNLGNMLEMRYERTREAMDLEEAINSMQKAIKLTPEDHLDFPTMLNNLGNKLERRYEQIGNVTDLEEAIILVQESIKLTPENHPGHATWLHTLGNMFQSRYTQTEKTMDLKKAIKSEQKAIKLTAQNHPDRVGMLISLGLRLICMNQDQESNVIQLFLQAWNCTAAIPFARVRASILAIPLLQNRHEYEQAYRLSLDALNILPRVHNRSLSRDDQQCIISNFSGLAAHGCALALQTEQPAEAALKMLEQGRAAILNLLIDDRSDTSMLKKAQPDLCAKYERLRLEVNQAGKSTTDQALRERTIERQPMAIEEFEECIRCIRQLPTFKNFQKGLEPEQMQECAKEGHIVVVNVTALRSDAIIVSEQGFSTTPLPLLDAAEIENWISQNLTILDPGVSKNKDYQRFLLWLWQRCVKPILGTLKYQKSSTEDLPRIWWIGTGLASSLPFHAAGDIERLAESSYSRVISSYAPSIKALHYSRTRTSRDNIERHATQKILIATMPSTAGAPDLPGANTEKSAIIEAVGAAAQVQLLDRPTVRDVVQHLESCNIAHFACHGLSNPQNPSESGLFLESDSADMKDAKADVLSVGRVSEAYLPQADIAYLSACSTAENQADRLEDEVLHVVSGFQVAGFRHVIGCLWPSLDDVCVEVAKMFYSNLIRDGNVLHDDRAVAIALHRAVTTIREREEYRKRPLLWAQYVHFGA